MRASGTLRAIRASRAAIASSVGASRDQIGVLVPPGVTWLTRMPRGASSDARLRVMVRTPPLAAAYADHFARRVHRLLVAADDGHPCALRQEQARRGETNAAVASRDQRRLVREPHVDLRVVVRGSRRGSGPGRATSLPAGAIVIRGSEAPPRLMPGLLDTALVVCFRRRNPDGGFMCLHINSRARQPSTFES